MIRRYLHSMPNTSWSWKATNCTVLRTVFDKLGGMNKPLVPVTPDFSTREKASALAKAFIEGKKVPLLP